ncbi:hypothetical protein PHYBLDRAFT_72015 [Phycomyces blakesleeanus NRRL 1555(-)]|uniref:BTB domain-containing protein n=1 Tax=Phycomyces blakesleeanus (strain ATCC 8743b / DSM 1359 / FGSC 10004 / NBRC 33097 / NRRL 1555) TaxID=763407 RepID=A0A167N7D2_PHYB8|nr:hypothetical protein PHYBLDRAFT_72015 [Phycomyces blakesleeanus NRRL 1555(-)]OAD75220.1 hypothetical protein PHYBLDRAFT_72015 [Phycomyces blakesleeanus NRRL 1555(-)]|eukprot:XP_018293260.1 hypothetical protein PHYBLDRAFT_72015 [Phycomyces blakesleeanus NRRL 1555(-)]
MNNTDQQILGNTSHYKYPIHEWSNIPLFSNIYSPHFYTQDYTCLKKGSKEAPGSLIVATRLALSDNSAKPYEIMITFSIKKKSDTSKSTRRNGLVLESNILEGLHAPITLKALEPYIYDDCLNVVVSIDKLPRLLGMFGKYPPGHGFLLVVYDDLRPSPNVIIRVSKDEKETENVTSEAQIYYSNKHILIKNSAWFSNMFLSGMRESEDSRITIRGVDPQIFGRILHFIYTQEIPIESMKDSIDIIKVADRLQFDKVNTKAFNVLKDGISRHNVLETWRCKYLRVQKRAYTPIDQYEYTEIQDLCYKYMRRYCGDILKSPEWLDTDGQQATKILKIDCLDIPVDETIFFEAVINWRKANITRANRLYEDNVSNLCSEPSADNKVVYNCENEFRGADSKLQEKFHKKKATLLKEIDYYFAEMVRSVRFTQIKKEYLAETVQQECSVRDVYGLHFLLRMAYKNLAFSKGIKLEKNYGPR